MKPTLAPIERRHLLEAEALLMTLNETVADRAKVGSALATAEQRGREEQTEAGWAVDVLDSACSLVELTQWRDGWAINAHRLDKPAESSSGHATPALARIAAAHALASQYPELPQWGGK